MNGLPGMWRLNMTIAVGFSVHNMNRCCPNAHVRVLFIDKKKGHELWPSHYLQQTLKNINLFKAAKYLTQQLVER